jgi:hypothetical protein
MDPTPSTPATQRYREGHERREWSVDFGFFKSHAYRVSREDAKAQGIKVVDLESDPELQAAVLSVHHATRHTSNGTPALKIIE